MTYKVRVERPAQKAIRTLQPAIKERVLRAIRSLADEPRPTGAKKLKGAEAWRIRVNDYRIVYTINDGELVVTVITVGHRREVYRG